tara:strand:- start:1429 stop:2127 length:699 start_codon:yes stop_codon:yes gene_type:complete
MKLFRRKVRIVFDLVQYWFHSNENIKIKSNQIVEIKESRFNYLGLLKPVNNAILQIDQSLDVIFDSFDKKLRYEIKRSEKENLTFCKCDDNIKLFNFYVKFSKHKNISYHSFDFFKKLTHFVSIYKGNYVRCHSFFGDHNEIILISSFVCNEKNISNSLKGFANRGLHWYSIQYFKNQGVKIYNFGGIGNEDLDPSKKAIKKFKEEFNPEIATYYSGILRLNILSKIHKILR